MRTGVSERGCSVLPNPACCSCHQRGFALKCSHSVHPHNPRTNTFASVVPAFSRLAVQKTTCVEQRGAVVKEDLASDHASIDWDGRTSHVRRICRSNKGDHVSDLLRFCQT